MSINQISFTSSNSIVYDIFQKMSIYFKNLDSANSLPFTFNNADGYFEEYNENNYLVFALTDKNRSIRKLQRTLE